MTNSYVNGCLNEYSMALVGASYHTCTYFLICFLLFKYAVCEIKVLGDPQLSRTN